MYKIAVDRGGTFTDLIAFCPDNKIVTLKVLSSQPNKDGPFEAIKQLFQQDGNDINNTNLIHSIRMGTTVATNCLLEHKGEKCALILTKGFRDILQIGNQAREDIFEIHIADSFCLYSEVIEVDERVIICQEGCQLPNNGSPIKEGISGDRIQIVKTIDKDQVYQDLARVYAQGIRSVAIALIHSYTFPDHELIIEEIAKSIGFPYISLSSKLMPMIRYVPRAMSSVINSYLTPSIITYINNFMVNFDQSFDRGKLLFMQSDGGLTDVDSFQACRSILSGPAGGVVGYSLATTNDIGNDKPIIGFDMGGTSTDVSRFDGKLEHRFESKIAGVSIQTPHLDIQTVAAGGGSRLYFRNGLFVVGPESSGSYPGPICYRNNGYLSITDANLHLGRIVTDYFPKIFGKNGNEPLDKEAVSQAFEEITSRVNKFYLENNRKEITTEEVAMGFIRVANETMCRPIRKITQGRGYDASTHVLTCFGGAGGQHACKIARSLGVRLVFVHKFSGILSAYGIALADIVHEEVSPCSLVYKKDNVDAINSKIKTLVDKCTQVLLQQNVNAENIKHDVYLNLRYDKTDCAFMINAQVAYCDESNYRQVFLDQYQREFGFVLPDRAILCDDIRVRGIGCFDNKFLFGSSHCEVNNKIASAQDHTMCYFEDAFVKTPVYLFKHLCHGHQIEGPAIIVQPDSTIIVEPFCRARITRQGNILIDINECHGPSLSLQLDSIYLSIFSHFFMSIAEQMGVVLQKTAISTNIKERMDYSCALFGPSGYLVSNAPHIPVHLGSMGKCVEYLIHHHMHEIKPGNIFLSNHPCAGGTHLPDLTVITPVFHADHRDPIFYVASRGHHADIGGATPGSMPSFSTSINQEGASFICFKIVEQNVFQEESLTRMLQLPASFPGCSGTRALSDNLSDLKAQIASNHKGGKLVNKLIEDYGLEIVLAYMQYIQMNAELEVRDLMKRSAKKMGTNVLSCEDFMDDGTPIRLCVTIDEGTGGAVFHFSGSGQQVWGNWNAPKAITYSAIIYCLRCMIGHDMPLNYGCLVPIQVILPHNSILAPDDQAAVVGGNVLTSQRITDVIFKAFEICADSQGCMNNITFGDESFSYYETVAGGVGATAKTSGRSGVQSHMTNTRMTDIEILEKKYPVLLDKFTVNVGSGGKGKNCGGNGVIRELRFRKNLTLSVLTERRVFPPNGLKHGLAGSKGKNTIRLANGLEFNLGSKNTIQVGAGDVFRLETPGGGGWGQSQV